MFAVGGIVVLCALDLRVVAFEEKYGGYLGAYVIWLDGGIHFENDNGD